MTTGKVETIQAQSQPPSAAHAASQQGSLGGPLQIPLFRNVWIGATISQLGDVCYKVALPWLVLQMTGSSLALGSILMAVAVPRAVLLLVGGVISDRFAAATVLIVANVAQAISVAIVALLAFRHWLRLDEIYVLAFSFGVAGAFSAPALNVLLPELVGPKLIQRANSLVQSTSQICMLAGGAIAGLLISRWGVANLLFIDSISFIALIAALVAVPRKPRASGAKSGMWRAILEGLRYVYGYLTLRYLIILIAAINFFVAGATQVGLAALAHFRFASSTDFGLMVSAVGAGSVAGIVAAGVWRHKFNILTIVVSASLALGVLLASLAIRLPIWSVCGIVFLLGLVAGYVNVSGISWLQRTVKKEVLGRVVSVVGFATAGVAPISLAIGGVLAQMSISALFIVSGSMLFLAAILVRFGKVGSEGP